MIQRPHPSSAMAAALLLGLVLASTPAAAGAYKVMSVDQKAMLVLDQSSVRRSGGQVSARALIVRNLGLAEPGFYDHPFRTTLTIDCGARTVAATGGASKPISRDGALAQTAGWVCNRVEPPHALEASYFGALARAYRDYVAVTPGVFFLNNP